MSNVAVRLEAVSHAFHAGTPNEVRALDSVELELERGTFTVVLGTNGSSAPLLRVTLQDDSELAGVAFNPAGTHLYFSSQRGGPAKKGVTYEVTGPFAQRAATAAASPASAARPAAELPDGPSAGLHTQATPRSGITARMPPPTPLLAGSPTR